MFFIENPHQADYDDYMKGQNTDPLYDPAFANHLKDRVHRWQKGSQDTLKEVVRWLDEPCQHKRWNELPTKSRHNCTECMQELKEAQK